MTASDDRPQLRDIPAALGLLSRLPVRVDSDHAQARGAKAAWAYPLAGVVMAVLAVMVGQGALWLNLPAALAAGLALATMVIVTGAMHEDGLADSGDGLWGGWTPERRLEIMKDSHIGAYGVIALVLSLGLRWQALSVLIAADLFAPALIATAALSRAAMVPLMAGLPHARATGLSHLVGRASVTTASIACALGGGVAILCLGLAGFWVIACLALVTLTCARIAMVKIKGQTGDILGATQQLCESAGLMTLCALVA